VSPANDSVQSDQVFDQASTDWQARAQKSSMLPVELSLYTRHNCSLCEDMHFVLLELADDLVFSIQLIDVDSDQALVDQYNELVPVLKLGDAEICHHFFNYPALTEALDAERAVN